MTHDAPSPATAPAARPSAQSTIDIYNTRAAVPLLLAALAWTVALILRISPELHPIYGEQAKAIMNLAYVVFVTDLVIRLLIDRSITLFLRSNWAEIVALVIPVLRLALVAILIRKVTRDRGSRLAERVFLFAALSSVVVVVLGAAVTLYFEAQDPSANIQSMGDSSWWAITTVVTVGYGDFVPVTVAGRVTATIVMFAGAAVVSSLTAAIASRWAGKASGASAADTATMAGHIVELRAEVSRLTALLDPKAAADRAAATPRAPE